MKKLSLFAGAVMAATLFATTGASAQTAADMVPYKGDLPAPLAFAKSNGALEVFKSFPAAGDLTGWLVQDKNSGKNIIVYTTKDREVLLAGMALDKSGKNLTSVYSEQHVPQPDYTAALAEFHKAGATVVTGSPKAKAEITVIFDPNCGFCKVMHRLVAPAVDAGELRVVYLPVAILGGDSDLKAAGILASRDPSATLHAGVEGRADASSDKALLAKVLGNTALMKKHGFTGTPGVLYKGKKGGDETVFIANGVPNISEMFQRLGINGQVDKLRADPQLARFVR